MSTFGELLRYMPAVAAEEDAIPIDVGKCAKAAETPTVSIRDEQIHTLVQQLFFRHEAGAVRNVGFAPVEASLSTASLCLDVVKALAEECSYNVGLIDASIDGSSVQDELGIQSPKYEQVAWPIGPHLWLVPRRSWWPEAERRQPVTDQNLDRLRELMTEFDFSVACCSPVCWITERIGLNCDGLVLVLTANKTRRLVAAQIKERMGKIRVALLGTILAERVFPVPQGLYRSL
ncbi:MAG: hypothetical protein ABSG70_10665 [Terriglobales bacterium]|jgi:Mrp family chromosome partitioning ATPase